MQESVGHPESLMEIARESAGLLSSRDKQWMRGNPHHLVLVVGCSIGRRCTGRDRKQVCKCARHQSCNNKIRVDFISLKTPLT